MADIRTVEKFSRLEGERAELKSDLAKIEAEIKKLHGPVLTYFQAHGVQNMACEGRTLYLKRDVHAAKVNAKTDPEDLVRILHATGFEDLAPHRVSWQSLSALFREREKNGEEAVPEALQSHFTIAEQFKVGSRKQ